jgi:hypothetical protein
MRYLIALIAAVLAVLGFAGHASAQATSTGWYGYVVTGSTYTSTTADWTMPSLTCTSQDNDEYVAIWTGLDGYSSPTTEQIGVLAECLNDTTEYVAWYDMYPGTVEDFDNTLEPGDDLVASVAYDGSSKFTLTLDDTTRGWDESTTQTLAGTDRSSAETVVEAPSTLSCVPAQTLADFTNDTVDGKALGDLDPVEVTGSDPDITVSAVSGKSFSVTCEGSV